MYLIDVDQPSKKQKFRRGQVVKIAKNLGPSMTHFPKNRLAIVNGNSGEERGFDFDLYELIVKDEYGEWDEIAWYKESQLKEVDDISLCKEFEKNYRKYKRSLR